MRLVYDTEGDGLRNQCTRLWCIVAKDIDSGQIYQFKPNQIEEGISLLDRATVLICHNQIAHDLPILRKHYGWEPRSKGVTIIDTLVMSRSIWPDRIPHPLYNGKAPHSVEAYGVKFRRKKPEHEDWSQYSEAMLHRCTEDVEIQHLIYDFLQREAREKQYPEFSLRLEHEVAKIIVQQEIDGIPFDKERAEEYVFQLKQWQAELYEKVRPYLGYGLDTSSDEKAIKKRTIARPFGKDGNLSKKLLSLCKDRPMSREIVGGPFTYIDIDLGSRDTLIHLFKRLGWVPREFTEKGNPKLTDKGKPVASLLEFEGGVGRDLAKWFVLKHRRSVIEGWINAVRDDGRITPGANPCGANTSRMQHNTVVNVPKVTTDSEGNLVWDIEEQADIFGTQMRSLFIAPPPYVLVGYDASGLENRMLAHWMNDPDLTREILHGDFHTRIWKQIEEFVHSRSNTKNVEYALFYGASDKKIGSMADYRPPGMSESVVGAEIRKRIMKGLPALDDLTRRVQREARNGYVLAPDNRRLFIRSEHSALNTKLQGSGAVVMKVSLLYLRKWARREGLFWWKVLDMHDEGQNILPDRKSGELFGNLAVQSIITSGQYLNLNCPLAAEYKIGTNWAETH